MHVWGLRLRRVATRSRYRASSYCLPVRLTPSAPGLANFGAHDFGIPSLHMPLSNASSAPLRVALAWLGVRMDRYSFPV